MSEVNLRPFQIRVIYFISTGMSALEVALKLGIAEHTVYNYVYRIKRKYNLVDREQFVDFAVNNQVITEDKVKRGIEWNLRLKHSTGAALTPRELEVVKLIATGLSSSEIAFRLKIETKTVGKFRQAAMDKLDCHNTAKICFYVFRNNLLSFDEVEKLQPDNHTIAA